MALAKGADYERPAETVTRHLLDLTRHISLAKTRRAQLLAVNRNTPPPPRANANHTNGTLGNARRTRVSVLPTSTTSTPPGVRWRVASRSNTRTASMPSRPASNAPGGLMRIFRRQAPELRRPDIGRIADDDIVAAPLQRCEIVGFQQPQAPRKAKFLAVDACHRQRILADIHRIDLRARGKPARRQWRCSPDPVPRSRIRRTCPAATQGEKRASTSSAIGERGISTRSSTYIGRPANQQRCVR